MSNEELGDTALDRLTLLEPQFILSLGLSDPSMYPALGSHEVVPVLLTLMVAEKLSPLFIIDGTDVTSHALLSIRVGAAGAGTGAGTGAGAFSAGGL